MRPVSKSNKMNTNPMAATELNTQTIAARRTGKRGRGAGRMAAGSLTAARVMSMVPDRTTATIT